MKKIEIEKETRVKRNEPGYTMANFCSIAICNYLHNTMYICKKI